MTKNKPKVVEPVRQPLKIPPSLFIPGERMKSTGVAHWYTQ